MTSAGHAKNAAGRAAWFAARARNATRRTMLVGIVGGAAAILTLLVLVLVPREVNRAIRAQLDALPPMRDTAAVAAVIASRTSTQQRAEASLRAARRADSAIVAMLASRAIADSDSDSVGTRPAAAQAAPRDAESADLQQRVNRARVAPLFENYRELAQAALLRNDPRVRAIIDTLGQVDREREAFAALGGIDARYAALSARLNTLGQRLLRLAEEQLIRPTASTVVSNDVDLPFGTVPEALPRRNPEELQQLTAAAASAQQDVQRAEQELVDVRNANAQLLERRRMIMSRADIRIPPMASLIAAMVIGVFVGYAVAFVLELRVPRIADGYEAERIADTRVIVHGASTRGDRESRSRRRADRAMPPALDSASETYQLIHLTLTGLGEVARRVLVIGDAPTLTATVAANLAAAAAREARAVLLIDLDLRHRLIAPLLRVTDRRGMSEVLTGDAEVLEVLRDFPVGRDVYMTVLYGGQRAPRNVTSERRMVVHEDIERLAARYDLAIIVGDEAMTTESALLAAPDVVLCTRVGTTPNAWLARQVAMVRNSGQRLRAVLSWTA